MERLIATHLESLGHVGAIPELDDYLMPCSALLRGLESENPEALAVIEGLNLPGQVILLPMPMDLPTDAHGLRRTLREYWARRFEGEVARTWQWARENNQDLDRFGLDGLAAVIGDIALAEVREVLIRDNVIPPGMDDSVVCRSFVARVVRLRYFSPGARGFFFPALRDWQAFDHWLAESGLDLPPPRPNGPLPPLLEYARPGQRTGSHVQPLLLPGELPHGCSDPDFQPSEGATARAIVPEAALTPQETETTEIGPPLSASASTQDPTMQARCLDVLRQGLQLPRKDWKVRARDWLLGVFAPLLELLLVIANGMRRRTTPRAPHGVRMALHLLLLRHCIRTAQRAELQDRYATAIVYLGAAERRLSILGESCPTGTQQAHALLAQRRASAEEALADLLAAQWKLSLPHGRALGLLIARLGADVSSGLRSRKSCALLGDLEKVLLESRATYYQLRLLYWLRTLGRGQIRQIMPFQANLKALRALDAASNRLERLDWPIDELERSTVPLRALSERLTEHLDKQLEPHLRRALHEAGFTARSHRQEVAFHKLLCELLDVIALRRHLKFTDVRDIVARNLMRLPDLSFSELLHGDRLSRFDRAAARTLPGVYKPGELYIKGLQQLGAPLFGTPRGRVVLRHLVLPLALAFLGLKTLDVLIGLVASETPAFNLANPFLVAVSALAFNAIAYTRAGRLGARALLHGTLWVLRLLLFDGLRRFARWRPMSRLLQTTIARTLDRNLLRPFLVGTALMLPVLGLVSLIEGAWLQPGPWIVALTLALGVLIRNTPAGRRMLDDFASATSRLLQRLNQTLVIGLVQELMRFFKELTRRFQQGLHRIEERLSHHLGESLLQLVLKSLLLPVWRLLESFIQFYATVLIEPQINPIKHFPLVTIAHKLMLPFLPLITGLLADLLDPLLPKWIALPFVTLTVLLLPGLAGFLVWELKENWKLYAANHQTPVSDLKLGLEGGSPAVRRTDLADPPVEPAIVGGHGETMRGFLRRGFHSGTLPKAFERLASVLSQQIRTETDSAQRLREALRQLAEVEHAIKVFCDRELAHALRRRCKHPDCALVEVETHRPYLATASCELRLSLHTKDSSESDALQLCLRLWLIEPELHLSATLSDPNERLGAGCLDLICEDLEVFSGRAGATRLEIDFGRGREV